MLAATFLNVADYVVSLEAGGSMRYSNTIEHWNKDHDVPPSLEDPDPEKEEVALGSGTQISEEPLPREKASDVDGGDKRRSGDSSDWSYYLKRIGLKPIMAVVLLSVGTTVCESFPRI
jgi:hypothetical protein